jgi:ADP-heptose:LPS heptosyltransferase
MRYYLEVEQLLGRTLPGKLAPALAFTGSGRPDPWHVVFVSATSWPGRKDYGFDGFVEIAHCLKTMQPGPWRFTLIPGATEAAPAAPGLSVLARRGAAECLDVFATAVLVIGNDTGLTHLAALTQRDDGTSPQVIGLYGRHAHTKWTTGRENHHAVATAFSQRLSDADRCPVRDRIDDSLWGSAADVHSIPASVVALFALNQIAARQL